MTTIPPTISILLNGNKLLPAYRRVGLGLLSAEVISPTEWPNEALEPGIVRVRSWAFCTQIDDYVDLEKKLHELRGDWVNLGEAGTLVGIGERVGFDLELGNLYDIFSVGYTEDGFAFFAERGRYGTIRPDDRLPGLLTFDEACVFALGHLGLPLDSRVEAKVFSQTPWGISGRHVIAGFDFGEDPDSGLPNHRVLVGGNGKVRCDNGRTAEQMREFVLGRN